MEPAKDWLYPLEHEEQVVDPAAEENFPAGQAVHWAEASAEENVPAGHSVQTEEPAEDVFPAGQEAHWLDPPDDAYLPAGHAAHEDCCSRDEKNPGAQLAQSLLATPLQGAETYLPAGQLVHAAHLASSSQEHATAMYLFAPQSKVQPAPAARSHWVSHFRVK